MVGGVVSSAGNGEPISSSSFETNAPACPIVLSVETLDPAAVLSNVANGADDGEAPKATPGDPVAGGVEDVHVRHRRWTEPDALAAVEAEQQARRQRAGAEPGLREAGLLGGVERRVRVVAVGAGVFHEDRRLARPETC